VLIRRLGLVSGSPGSALFPIQRAPAAARSALNQRSSLRGHRRTACGRDLLLAFAPRGALESPRISGRSHGARPGDQWRPGPEPLLQRAQPPIPLAPPVGPPITWAEPFTWRWSSGGQLRLLQDSVLEELLHQRGLVVERITAPVFSPKSGGLCQPTSPFHSHSHSTEPLAPGAAAAAAGQPGLAGGGVQYSEGRGAVQAQRIPAAGDLRSWLEAEARPGAIAIAAAALGPLQWPLASMARRGSVGSKIRLVKSGDAPRRSSSISMGWLLGPARRGARAAGPQRPDGTSLLQLVR